MYISKRWSLELCSWRKRKEIKRLSHLEKNLWKGNQDETSSSEGY